MGPNWQQQQQRMQQQRQQQQRQQQLLREQMERSRKQQEAFQQQQKQAAWWQQQQKKNKQVKGNVQGNVPPINLDPALNQVNLSNQVQKKRGGCAKVVNLVVTLIFLAFAIYVVLLVLGNL